MSDTIHFRLSRALAVAGILGAAGAFHPGAAAAQAVTAEQALLHTSPEAGVPSGLRPVFLAPAEAAVASAVTGEQALQGRTSPQAWTMGYEVGVISVGRPPIGGAEALLGRRDGVAGWK